MSAKQPSPCLSQDKGQKTDRLVLILADEPTASLDPKNSEELLSILESLKNPNRTIIIATHNPLIGEQAN